MRSEEGCGALCHKDRVTEPTILHPNLPVRPDREEPDNILPDRRRNVTDAVGATQERLILTHPTNHLNLGVLVSPLKRALVVVWRRSFRAP